MKVTYSSSSADTWRCNLYCILRNSDLYFMVLNAAMIAAFFGWWLKLTVVEAAYFGAAVYGVYLIWMALALKSVAERANALPKRFVTAELTPDGIQETTLEVGALTAWSKVLGIAFVAGDVYFLKRGKNNSYVPRSAFTDSIQARRFYDAAVAARSGDYSKTYEPLGALTVPPTVVDSGHMHVGGVQTADPRNEWQIARIIGSIGLAFFVGVLVYGVTQAVRGHELEAQYAESPGCTRTSPALSSLAPCTLTTMRVIASRSEHHRRSDSFFLTLSPKTGDAVEVQIDSRVAFAAPVNRVVTAKMWRGVITLVIANSIASTTDFNPARTTGDGITIILLGLAGVLFSSIALRSGYLKWIRKTKASGHPLVD